MKFSKLTLACLTISGGLLLSACGGGNSSPVNVATGNAVSSLNPTTGKTTAAAVTGKTFTYSTPVPLVGTKADGTAGTAVAVSSVKFGGTTDAPTFEIASDKGALTGDLSFGSCIFTIKTPTQLAGEKITVNPCSVTFATSGLKADGSSNTANGTLTLGSTASNATPFTMVISPTGTITIGSVVIAVTVPVAAGTGS